MNSYTKLFSSIVTSSIWQEDSETKVVWVTMLALADQHGEVAASVPGLAHLAGVSVDAAEKALAKFLAPDLYSRTKKFEGRRIEEIDGGWVLLNHGFYREKSSQADRQEQNRIRQQRHRERQGAARNADVTPRNADVTPPRSKQKQKQIQNEEKPRARARTGGSPSDESMIPDRLNTPEFRKSWDEWLAERRSRGNKVTPKAAIKQFKFLEAMGVDRAIKSIDQSITNGWTGLFEPKDQNRSPNPTGGPNRNKAGGLAASRSQYDGLD